MEIQHLKGEWNVVIMRHSYEHGDSWGKWTGYIPISNDDVTDYGADIAEGSVEIKFIVENVSEGTARLISAAPELLEACEKGLPELKQYLNDVGHDPSVGIDASSLIDAIECMAQAIKKATQP